jgi:hypothetical protein
MLQRRLARPHIGLHWLWRACTQAVHLAPARRVRSIHIVCVCSVCPRHSVVKIRALLLALCCFALLAL